MKYRIEEVIKKFDEMGTPLSVSEQLQLSILMGAGDSGMLVLDLT